MGLGTWQAARGVVGRAVADALDLGYVHIDCAAAYANECEVGESLAAAMGKGTVKRENLFVTSKLWVRSHFHRFGRVFFIIIIIIIIIT